MAAKKKISRKSAASSSSPKVGGRRPSVSSHGGSSSHGRRKDARPLEENALTHIVLTSGQARGAYAFAKHRSAIEATLKEKASDFGVDVEGFEIHGKHLHVFLRFQRREDFQGFMRTVTGMLARRVTGARKGKPFGRKFWDHLAFTRKIASRDGAVETFKSESDL